MRAFTLVILGFVAVAALAKKEGKDLSHGFGDEIEWTTLENALQVSKEQNKPVFLLIHKTWCGACKALKKNIQQSNKRAEFIELSKKFVMVNTEDDEEPEEEKYAPDGAYIPRLLFLDQNTDLLAVDNKKNFPNNAYYFPQAVDVIKAMKRALKEHGTEVEEEKPAETKKSTKKLDKEEAVAEEKKEKSEKKSDKKTEEKKEKVEKKEKKAEKKSEEKKEKSEKKVDDKKAEKKEKKAEKKEEKPAKKDKKAEKKDEKSEKKTEKKEKSDKKKDDKKKKTEL
uniref:Thioredoxin domain-containing protein n=1 Tax=Panagrellus redivivus TaxID=6233 RepID=A0A7E4ZT01_PANRE